MKSKHEPSTPNHPTNMSRFIQFIKRVNPTQFIENNVKHIGLINVALWTSIGMHYGYNYRKTYERYYGKKTSYDATGKYTVKYPLTDHITDTMGFTFMFGCLGVVTSCMFVSFVELFGAVVVTGPLLVGGIISTGVCIGRTIENGNPWKDPIAETK